MSEWISVKDRLPDGFAVVLALVSGKPKTNLVLDCAYELAEYLPGEGWYIETYPDWDDPIITYWMELPYPPDDVR